MWLSSLLYIYLQFVNHSYCLCVVATFRCWICLKQTYPILYLFLMSSTNFFKKSSVKLRNLQTLLKSFGLEFVFLEKSNVWSSVLRIVVMGSEMISEKNHLVM